ncbi:MAG: hypothetical protein RLZZ316_738 [Bacteroidota bacterium]
METIEIRQNKKKTVPLLVVVILITAAMAYLVLCLGKLEDYKVLKFFFIVLTAIVLYRSYFPVKMLLKNVPILIFDPSALTLNEKGNPLYILWHELVDWKIEKNTNEMHYLIVTTAHQSTRLNISWLDKSPAEIDAIFTAFDKRKAL